MKTIYICSPLRGDYETNLSRAKQYCRAVALGGNIPIAPHVYCTSFLDDTILHERKAGMAIGIELLKFCDELMICGDRISEGMAAEILEAERRGIQITYA